MSSTSNAQDLLVNVFRPTYRWDSNTGFVPSLTLSNVTEIITESVTTDRLAVSDSNLNTYIGSNAGATAIGTASNVGLGYSAMAGSLNSSNNVAVGMFSLDGLSNSDCNVALGARTDITGRGQRNVLIGPDVTMGDGSGNILIGVDISAGNVTKRFQLGTLLYGDLSSGYLGVNTTAPTRAFDVSGVTVFRGKVGFQNDNPVYSLDVNGSIGVSERFIGSNGSVSVPIYSFGDSNASNSGLFVPTDASYGLGAVGVSVRGQADVVIASNKTYIFNGLDVCGTITSSGGSASFLAGPGSVTEPAYSFKGASNLGLYRTTDASGSAVGIAIGGTSRFVVGSNKVTIFGNMDVCGAFSAVSGGGGSGGGTIAANGSAAAPSFTFSNDSTTGLFLQSASNLGFATGGVRRMTILNTGDVSAGQLVVSGYLRNTTNGSRTLDISSGNISNSATSLAGTFETINALTTNRIGGVVLESSNVTNSGTTQSGTFFTMADTTSNQIAGVTLSNFDLCMSSTGRILGMSGTSNVIGGVTLSNTNISYAGTITGSTANTSNQIGGVTLSNGQVTASGTTSSIGNVTLSSGGVSATTGTLTPNAPGSTALTISAGANGTITPVSITGFPAQIRISNATPGNQTSVSFATATGDIRVGNNVGDVGDGVFAISNTGVRMVISNSNVGIGTVAPGSTLDISSTGTYGIQVRNPAATGNIGVRISNGFGGTGDLGVAGANGAWTGGALAGDTVLRANCNFHVEAKAATRLSVTDLGVGVGTSAPAQRLDVSATLRVGNGNALFDIIPQGGTAEYAVTTTNGHFVQYRGGSTNKATSNLVTYLSTDVGGSSYFLSNNIGVGVSVPGTELDVSGTARSTTLVARPVSTSSVGGIGLAGNRVAVGTGTFGSTFMVAVGQGINTLAYSTNSGVSWVGLGTTIFSTIAYDVAWNGSIWVASGSGTNGLAYSYDGINWVGVGTSVLTNVRGVAWSGSRWVAVGNGANTIAYSADGITWTGTGTSVFSVGGNFVAWGGNQFVAVGDGATNTVATSPDGITWTGRGKPFSSYGTCIAYNGSLWVITGVGSPNDTVYTSTDAITWTGRSITGGTFGWSVAWNGSLWVIGSQGTTKIFTSTDGLTWTAQSTTNFGTVVGMAWNGAFWVASTDGTTKIATSPDGVTWTARDAGTIFSTGSWFSASQRFALPITAADGLVLDVSGGNIRTTGRIGIGTAPAYPLHVSGQALIRDTGSNSGTLYLGDTVGPVFIQRDQVGHGYVRASAAANLYLGTSNTNWVTLTNAGNFGIGVSPSYLLHLNSDSAAKPSTNTWTISSDRRIKQDIARADTSLCYNIIKQLPLQRFTWDASFMPNVPDKKSVGWIAQDVKQVFPNAVTCVSNAWFEDFHGLDVDQLYKTMYGALEKVIADKEALEAQVATQDILLQTILTRLATLEASQQSSESTQTTPPTPPPPSESPESSPEPQQPPSSEYAPAPAETEA